MSVETLRDDHTTLVRRLLDQVYGGDPAIVDQLVSRDYRLDDWAGSGSVYGPTGLALLADRYRRAFRDLRLTIEDQVAAGNTVVTRWQMSTTDAGKLVGLSPGPGTASFHGRRVSHVRDGKVVYEQVHWDTLDLIGAGKACDAGLGPARGGPERGVALAGLEAAQIEETGALLARAFADEPMYVYVLPDDVRRDGILPAYCEAVARYGYLFGEVHVTGGPLTGAAVWVPPASGTITPEQATAARFPDVTARLEAEARGRLLAMTEHLGELRRDHVPWPHWYLMVVGVDPSAQGRGLGAMLLSPVLSRADMDGVPCYLETTVARNLPFYGRHGFEVVAESALPDGGPRAWCMLRPPSAS